MKKIKIEKIGLPSEVTHLCDLSPSDYLCDLRKTELFGLSNPVCVGDVSLPLGYFLFPSGLQHTFDAGIEKDWRCGVCAPV